MTRRIGRTNQFKRDLKLCKKRNYDLGKLQDVVDLLEAGGPLPDEYYEHPLSGSLKGLTECHITSNWLLIYEVSDDEVILTRTGTHADLFE